MAAHPWRNRGRHGVVERVCRMNKTAEDKIGRAPTLALRWKSSELQSEPRSGKLRREPIPKLRRCAEPRVEGISEPDMAIEGATDCIVPETGHFEADPTA